MTRTVTGTYRDGMLKLDEKLELADDTRVRIAVAPLNGDAGEDDPIAKVIGICKDGPEDLSSRIDEMLYGERPK
jgi:predicted DNA-binding antitoxin AbrB/MazE fold protein